MIEYFSLWILTLLLVRRENAWEIVNMQFTFIRRFLLHTDCFFLFDKVVGARLNNVKIDTIKTLVPSIIFLQMFFIDTYLVIGEGGRVVLQNFTLYGTGLSYIDNLFCSQR
jgi:hypothetical protein